MRVFLEIGKQRVFACALDWPGWCRSGKSEELALEALAAYAGRYAPVAKEAGVAFPRDAAKQVEMVERAKGTATTDFGAPGEVAAADRAPLSAAEAKRLGLLVAAGWTVFDRIAARTPAELRKGPRGGGRDRDKMIEHVLAAEANYARKLGVRHKEPAIDDRDAIDELRRAIVEALSGPPIEKGWPPRYAARRIAWHVLDHAWEMEDRAKPA